MVKWLMSACLFAALTGCGDSTGPETGEFTVIPPQDPQPAGDRLFGINPSESDQGFADSWELAGQAGVQVVEIMLHWNQVEPAQGEYTDPDGVLQAITFYGYQDVKVLVTLAVLNTVTSTVPDYLSDRAFDSPEMVNAFNDMSDWVFEQISPTVEIAGFAIGNEIDLVLEGSDPWSDYTGFYAQTAQHARQQRPDIPVGVKCTVGGGLLSGEQAEIEAINQYSDVIMLNCYFNGPSFQVLPPETVHGWFEQITGIFTVKDIWITEIGYQSGSQHCGSSQEKQAQFFHEMFTAWDDHRGRIQLMLVDFLHDQPSGVIDLWIEYYGLSDPGFVEFLSTLGLRNYDHTDKFAWLQVLEETSARGW